MTKNTHIKNANPFIVVLGIAQDGGVPHAGCDNLCCKKAWGDNSFSKLPTSIGVVDPTSNQKWIIDATPDFKFQLHKLNKVSGSKELLDGIFLTHGHVGHYTGLLQLEKAILNSNNIPVFVMPKLKAFLLKNQPWKNLIKVKNIKLKNMSNKKIIKLNKNISIKPFLVPHRAEYSETVGFEIIGPRKKIVFIPDIDSWDQMKEKIEVKIKNSDVVFLDGTFFDKLELPNRNISKVPHPFIRVSINRFSGLSPKDKRKVHFIHLNHTNPALTHNSKERKFIRQNGFHVTKEGSVVAI